MKNLIYCTIVNSSPPISQTTCQYEITDQNSIVLYISNNNPISYLSEILIKHNNDSKFCLLKNCKPISIGKDFDMFSPKEYFSSESKESLLDQKYSHLRFEISNEILNFFEQPWDFSNPMSTNNDSQIITFLNDENRKEEIYINNDLQLYVVKGYTQLFRANSYLLNFNLDFCIKSVNKLDYGEFIEIANCFSGIFCLFSEKVPFAFNFRLQTNEATTYYLRKPIFAQKEFTENYFFLIEREIKKTELVEAYANILNNRTTYNKIISLLKDYHNASNFEIKFICLFRMIELLHKHLFLKDLNAKNEYTNEIEEYKKNKYPTIYTKSANKKEKNILINRCIDLIRKMDKYVNDTYYIILLGKFRSESELSLMIDTRNYFIHYSSKKKAIIEYQNLEYYNIQLYTLCKIIILDKLGFREETIQTYLNKSRFWFS